MNKWLEILLGLILIIAAVFVSMKNYLVFGTKIGTSALIFLLGGIVWFVILIGLLFLMLGISDLKE